MTVSIKHRGFKLRSTHRPLDSSRSILSLTLILALALLLSSCIEYREEMWLEDDNSGHLIFEIGLPLNTDIDEEEISELSIVSLCDSVNGVDVTKHSTYQIDDNTWIHIELEFDDVLLLNDVENKWFGQILIIDDEKGERTFKRFITMSDTINVSSNQFGNMLKHAMLGQYSWMYTMHFPDELYETNAPIARTDTLSNSAMWEYNLASLINEQKVITGRYRHRQGLKGILQNLFKK